jgi:hypothetical protein
LRTNVRVSDKSKTLNPQATSGVRLRFQPVDATLCLKTSVSQKCFFIREIAKDSKPHRTDQAKIDRHYERPNEMREIMTCVTHALS